MDQRGDLGDVLVEETERVGVGQHQAGDLARVVVDLRPQVVHLDAAALVGGHLDHLVAGHRHRCRVGAVRGVGRQDLGPLFAPLGVEGAGEQQAGELAVRAGRGLQADVRQAADLRQRLLQQPHQLQRALSALGILCGVQARVTRQRRDPLVEPRVVLHRAGAERVETAVEVEVATREPVEVADDLRLGDLRQPRRLLAQQLGRDQLGERRLGHFGGRQHGGAPPRLRPLVDRPRPFGLHRRLGQRHQLAPPTRVAFFSLSGNKLTRSAATAAPSASASASIWARLRRSVIATSRPSSCSGYSRPSG